MITKDWQKARESNPSGNCLEAKGDGDNVLVRDTKLGEASPVLTFSSVDWVRFVQEIREGFTCPMGGMIETWIERDGMTVLDRSDTTTRLTFTSDEWQAFVAGAKRGQFDLQPA